MFNLLVAGTGWAESRDSMPEGRVLEYTDEELKSRIQRDGKVAYSQLIKFPALFLEEGRNPGSEVARIGTIQRAKVSGRDVQLEYTFDSEMPPLTNKDVMGLSSELDIAEFEFTRTHWAVKDVDLFKVLLRRMQPRTPKPKVFQISDPECVDPDLVSVMMPFDRRFADVYASLKSAVEDVGLRCQRADDIWDHPSVIQDIVSLIDRSRVVVCDCTDRNSNVFYEMGIAHTLGREVIPITQSKADIPFDVRHLRYLEYLPNAEGIAELKVKLAKRLEALA